MNILEFDQAISLTINSQYNPEREQQNLSINQIRQNQAVQIESDNQEINSSSLSRPINNNRDQLLQNINYSSQNVWYKDFSLYLTKGQLFQYMAMFTMIFCIETSSPWVGGLAFLEIEPPKFLCQKSGQNGTTWVSCTKNQICSQNLTKNQYKAVHSNIEYINNWVEQFGILCTPSYEIGFLGSCYFIGIIITIIPLPLISDYFGRRYVFLASMCVSLTTEMFLIFTKNFEMAFFLMIILGMCFSGKNIVGLNLLNEHQQLKSYSRTIVSWFYMDSFIPIFMSFFYYFIDRAIFGVEMTFVIIGASSTLFLFLNAPESPKFLHTKRRYQESKDVIREVALFNQVPLNEYQSHPLNNFVFEQELADQMEQNQDTDNLQVSILSDIGIGRQGVLNIENLQSIQQVYNESDINVYIQDEDEVSMLYKNKQNKSLQLIEKANEKKERYFGQTSENQNQSQFNRQFITNIIKMTVFWTHSSFCNYVMKILNQFLQGTIYFNVFLDGIASLVAISVTDYLYSQLKMRVTYIIATSLVVVTALLIILFQQNIINLNFLSGSSSPLQESTPQYLDIIVPILGFFVKMGINISFQCSYQASFGNPAIFPQDKRATATGICNFVARLITIFSPIVAELQEPQPLLLVCLSGTIAFIVALTLPNKEEENQILELLQKEEQLIVKEAKKQND